jgi:hypothetical protein
VAIAWTSMVAGLLPTPPGLMRAALAAAAHGPGSQTLSILYDVDERSLVAEYDQSSRRLRAVQRLPPARVLLWHVRSGRLQVGLEGGDAPWAEIVNRRALRTLGVLPSGVVTGAAAVPGGVALPTWSAADTETRAACAWSPTPLWAHREQGRLKKPWADRPDPVNQRQTTQSMPINADYVYYAARTRPSPDHSQGCPLLSPRGFQGSNLGISIPGYTSPHAPVLRARCSHHSAQSAAACQRSVPLSGTSRAGATGGGLTSIRKCSRIAVAALPAGIVARTFNRPPHRSHNRSIRSGRAVADQEGRAGVQGSAWRDRRGTSGQSGWSGGRIAA